MTGRPILVTGSHRSGTTWTGRLLGLSGEVFEIHEPFNRSIYHSWLRNRPRVWFQHVHAGNAAEWEPELTRVVGLRPPVWTIARRGGSVRTVGRALQLGVRAAVARRQGRRALLKDPIAFFAAEWLAERFATMNVVLVRHPAAFASSLMRLDWRFNFRNLLRQRELMATDLADFAGDIRAAARGEPDIIDQAVLLWRIFATRSLHYRRAHPDWLVLRYEDLAAEPVAGFAALYDRLGLTWTPAVARRVAEITGPGNVTEVARRDRGGVERHSAEAMWTWLQRLSPAEVARVRAGTADVAPAFYGDVDWRRSALGTGR